MVTIKSRVLRENGRLSLTLNLVREREKIEMVREVREGGGGKGYKKVTRHKKKQDVM